MSVPIWAAQPTTAISLGQISSAWRPEGNWIRAVSTYSGAPRGTRFWKKASPPPFSRVETTMPGCTPFGQRSSVVGRRSSARMMPSSTAR